MDQMDLTGISRTYHPNTKEYTFFLAPYGTFSKTDHIISHKTDLNIYSPMHPIRSPQSKNGLKFQQKQQKTHIHLES